MAFATLTHSVSTSTRRARGMVRTAAVLAAVLGLSLMASQFSGAPAAHAAAGGLRYAHGYSVQGSWLCYGWSNGTFHCTQRWHRGGGRLVSDNPAWVPSTGGVVRAPAATGRGAGHSSSAGSRTTRGAYWVGWRSGPYIGGECTWYAWSRAPRLIGLGNAANWNDAARARGFWVHSYPTVGSTAVFEPGVQGASGLGHVAHVEAVYGNGTFLVSEMAFYGFGGGWGRVSYRIAHTSWGVSFIN